VRGGDPGFGVVEDRAVAVEGFDVLNDWCGAPSDDGAGASGAAGFVAEVPAENRGREFVPVDDEFDLIIHAV